MIEIPDEYPWRDSDLMEALYHDKGLSYNQIADLFEWDGGRMDEKAQY